MKSIKKIISIFVVFCFLPNILPIQDLVANSDMSLRGANQDFVIARSVSDEAISTDTACRATSQASSFAMTGRNKMDKSIALKSMLSYENLSVADLLEILGDTVNLDTQTDLTEKDIKNLFERIIETERKERDDLEDIEDADIEETKTQDEVEVILLKETEDQKNIMAFRGKNPLKVVDSMKYFADYSEYENITFSIELDKDLDGNFVAYLYIDDISHEKLSDMYKDFISSFQDTSFITSIFSYLRENGFFSNIFSKKGFAVIIIAALLMTLFLPIAYAVPLSHRQDTDTEGRYSLVPSGDLQNLLAPTQNTTFTAAFLDRYEMLDFLTAGFQNSTVPFIRSYPYCGLDQYAFTYDQALVSMAFMAQRNLEIPRAVSDRLLSCQRHSSGLYYSAYSPITGGVAEWNVHTGFNAWVGLNFLYYADRMGGIENMSNYMTRAGEIGDALILRQAANGGIFGDTSLTWKSTEHNIDAFAFFDRLYQATNDARYSQARDRTWGWLSTVAWNSGANRFNRGESDWFFATDTTSFGILALGRERIEELGATVDALLGATDTYILQTVPFNGGNVTGYDFADSAWANAITPGRITMVSGEWTAQMCLSLLNTARTFSSPRCLVELRKLIVPSAELGGRGIVYATAANNPTSHGWNTPSCLKPSVAGTAFGLLAERGYNPFQDGFIIRDLLDIPQEEIYWMFRNQDRSPRGLLESYVGVDSLLHWGFTYDQALAAHVFIYRGEYLRARAVLETMIVLPRHQTGLLRSAYDTQTGAIREVNVQPGFNAWVGLASLRYMQATNTSDYLQFAVNLGDSLARLQQANGGLVGGPDVPWISTEHNIDAFVLFTRLHERTGLERFRTYGLKVQSWLENYGFNTQLQRFNRGENDTTLATDTTTFGILGLGQRFFDKVGGGISQLLSATESARVSVGFEGRQTAGYDFTNPGSLGRQGVISGEWTAQACLALTDISYNFTRLDCLQQMDNLFMLSKIYGGGIPYSTTRDVDTGHGWRTPDRVEASVAGTAWHIMARDGFNPLNNTGLTERPEPPAPPTPTPNPTQEPTVIPWLLIGNGIGVGFVVIGGTVVGITLIVKKRRRMHRQRDIEAQNSRVQELMDIASIGSAVAAIDETRAVVLDLEKIFEKLKESFGKKQINIKILENKFIRVAA